MTEMNQITKILICWEMRISQTPVSHIARHLGISRDTAHRWIREIGERGGIPELFIDDYLAAKKGSRKKRRVDGLLKKIIFRIREENNDCCGQKIQHFLENDHNIKLGTTTIYKVLAEKYQLRSRWKKNRARGSVPKAVGPREVVQMDTVDFGEVFAFTGIDIFTREADVILRPGLEAADGQLFLLTCMERRFDGFCRIIQTDEGPEFKAEFHREAKRYCSYHRYARPYKKNEQAYIESFNRSLRKECLGWIKYRPRQIPELTRRLEDWLLYYHYKRPHIGLGLQTPLEERQVSDI